MTTVFLVSGTSYTIPSGATSITGHALGAGGGGAGKASGGYRGAGGGGGEWRKKVMPNGYAATMVGPAAREVWVPMEITPAVPGLIPAARTNLVLEVGALAVPKVSAVPAAIRPPTVTAD
jgi:hypothetical protein